MKTTKTRIFQIIVISMISGIIGSLILGLAYDRVIWHQDHDLDKKEIYNEWKYEFCQAYEDNDKKIDCYRDYGILVNESLEEWADRTGRYYYPNRADLFEVIYFSGFVVMGIILLAFGVLGWIYLLPESISKDKDEET